MGLPCLSLSTMPSAKTIMRGAFAEFLAMTLFVFFGCGAPTRNAFKRAGIGANVGQKVWEPASVTIISLQFGFAITVLAYATVHYGGGHINCAVTFAMMLIGKCHVVTGFCYFVAQMCGSVLGAGLLHAAVSADSDALDRSASLGANGIQTESATVATAVLVETMGTFLLIITALTTAIDNDAITSQADTPVKGNKLSVAPIPIGLAVFMAHVVCIPYTGCSINPTRSFGPAVVANVWEDHWIWWAGPLLGSFLACVVWGIMQLLKEDTPDDAQTLPASPSRASASESRFPKDYA